MLINRFVGIFTSMLIPETKRKTLEELTGEDHYYNDDAAANDRSGDLSGSNSLEPEKNV